MTVDTHAWFDGRTYWIACPEHGEHVAEVVATQPAQLVRCLATYGAESFGEPARCERLGEVAGRM